MSWLVDMTMTTISVLLACLCFFNGVLSYDLNDKKFPDDFLLGVATASYQIEGAWNEGGKGENIWDRACHSVPSPIVNNDTADVACDSYHKYKEDVALLKELGVDVYRFSISWSRILPNGFNNVVNEEGVAYYSNLINELLANNITPLVTIYHWDLPQVLQDAGGWESEFIIDAYVDYARVCFEKFGGKVKHWLTFNEPKQTCGEGYGTGVKAPMIKSPGLGEYRCSYNLLKAHAKAWHMYDNEFRKEQKGQVGITIDSNWYEPASNSTEDLAASETKLQFNYGWYAHPVTHGDWSKPMKKNIARRSKVQGYETSRLPDFTREEIEYMKNTVDFLGLNSYSSAMAKAIAEPDMTTRGASEDSEVEEWQPSDWEGSASSWLKVTPWGTRKLLRWMKHEYKDIPIMVTENGYSDKGEMQDEHRIEYYLGYLSNIRDAMEKDKVNVFGYTAWSFMDNFEWTRGYSERFGLFHVDFNSPNRTRTMKHSAVWYQNFLKTRCLVKTCSG